MFTGLIEKTGIVTAIENQSGAAWTLVVDPGSNFTREYGASVAINGVCLTEVGHAHEGPLTFHVSHETLAKTALGELKIGHSVNLERAMRPFDRLGGHIVLGHVDGTGTVTEIRAEQKFYYVEVSIPNALAKYVVSKGSIAIDGTSLTVNKISDSVNGCKLSFMLIPVTWNTTRFANLKINDKVNIEVDMIAKHLERLMLPWKQS